ncbi:MAG: MFS transporter [Acidiferrobacter sp.]
MSDAGAPRSPRPLSATFRALATRDYRLWAAAALVSNLGTWMQRTAQDWLVLTQLTAHSAVALGQITALQFAPQVLLLPLIGYVADRLDRRRLLIVTQSIMALLALVLAVLVLSGAIRLWETYLLALLLGIAAAFDSPARGAFVADLVPPRDLANAVALNSLSFNIARACGPALGGILISSLGTGPVLLLNAVSFGAVLAALRRLRRSSIRKPARLMVASRAFAEGLRYVAAKPEIKAVLAMFFLIGAAGVAFPILISAMTVSVFHASAALYGLLMSLMAAGAVGGALFAASRVPRFAVLQGAVALLAVAGVAAAVAPGLVAFACLLPILGFAIQVFTTSANSLIQSLAEPALRARLLALMIASALGGAPIAGPLAGWIADHLGPRLAFLEIAVLAGLALAVGLRRRRAARALGAPASSGANPPVSVGVSVTLAVED